MFLRILQGPMRSKNSLFHGVSSTNLAGNLPYVFDLFLCWHVSHPVNYLWMDFIRPGKYKCWQIITSVLSSPGWRRYMWYHCTIFWSFCGINILSLYVISLKDYDLRKNNPFLIMCIFFFSDRKGSYLWYRSMSLKDIGNIRSDSS